MLYHITINKTDQDKYQYRFCKNSNGLIDTNDLEILLINILIETTSIFGMGK